MSEDPAPPPEEASDSPLPELDNLDHWTLPEDFALDEAFIRAGVREPPARTRIAIARHDAELARQERARTRPAAAPRLGRASDVRWPDEATVELPPDRKHTRWRRVVAVVVAFSLLSATVLGRLLPGSATPASGYNSGARLTNASTSTIRGITTDAAAGTCYSIGAMSSTEIDLQSMPCEQPHQYELVSHSTATDFPSYPDDSYWATYISPTCYASISDYVGKDRDQWPIGLHAGFFRPSVSSWNDGDRAVDCVTSTMPNSVGSARGA